MPEIAAANEETHEAWNGPLFDRFLKFRPIVATSLGAHGDEAIRRYPPKQGERVLDVGCGFGDTTQQLAKIVGDGGEVLGVDVAQKFIELAQKESSEAGAANVRFEVADVEVTEFEQSFDLAFARFGTMFFANPVAAMRHVRQALVPGGRLCMVVWRRKLDNDWLHRAEVEVDKFVDEPEETDEPTCGPGPFSMADADTTSQILLNAGFETIGFDRCDIDARIGDDLDEATDLVMSLGPAGEVIRLAGDEAEQIRPKLTSAVKGVMADFVTDDGVFAPSSTWIVTARAPDSSG